MRKLLNTLYITSPDSYLSLDGDNIVVLLCDEEKFRIPILNVENIVCFGYRGASPALMGRCADENISLNFLKPNGEFLAKITGKTKGSVYLRMAQYKAFDDDAFCLKFAKTIIGAKLHNTRYLLERSIRDNKAEKDVSLLEELSGYIKAKIGHIDNFNSIEEVMGFEGNTAKMYFAVFANMLTQQQRDFATNERSKRPPLDYVNCMLSYLYTILGLEIQSTLETVGLDPAVGFMHALRSGRASLAQDLIEELRAYMVDRAVISLINLKQITAKDFFRKEGGAILMTDEGRKKILNAWQERKKVVITHPHLGEKIETGLIPYAQAQHLARYLRGDTEEYLPFIAK